MNIKLFTLFVIINFSLVNNLLGQYKRVEEVKIFSSQIDNPITIEPIKQNNEYVFYAKNRSYYPYRLNFEFNDFFNLTPHISKRNYIIQPGKNKLFSISVKDERINHRYSYKISFKIGLPCDEIDEKFPYLIPIRMKDILELNYSSEQPTFTDYFKLQKGDTVFCMRKGQVAAVPNMYHDADRISQKESLEIIHKDNSVLIYENIDPENTFIKAGQIVYPGQPIGLISENNILEARLLAFQNDNMIKSKNIYYAINNSKVRELTPDFVNLQIYHPEEIVTKEMTKRERKKYNKNSL